MGLELARQLEVHLVRDVREGRAHAAARGELRDEHRGLVHDGVDEQLNVHA